VIVFHGYDDIALFAPLIDIPVGVGHLFQRIAPIDERFELARFNQIFEEQ
jgi:hypothetical protein